MNQTALINNNAFRSLMSPEIPKQIRQSRTFRVGLKKAVKKTRQVVGGRSLYPHELRQIEQEVAKYV